RHRSIMLLRFSNAPTAPEIYTLSLHDALPISGNPGGERPERAPGESVRPRVRGRHHRFRRGADGTAGAKVHRLRRERSSDIGPRSEEHTSELQSRENLVCRLLLEKKNAGRQDK